MKRKGFVWKGGFLKNFYIFFAMTFFLALNCEVGWGGDDSDSSDRSHVSESESRTFNARNFNARNLTEYYLDPENREEYDGLSDEEKARVQEAFAKLDEEQKKKYMEAAAKEDPETAALVEEALYGQGPDEQKKVDEAITKLRETAEDGSKPELDRALAKAKVARLEEAKGLGRDKHSLEAALGSARRLSQTEQERAQKFLAAQKQKIAAFRGGSSTPPTGASVPATTVSSPAPAAPTPLSAVPGRRALNDPGPKGKSFPISEDTLNGKRVEFSPVFDRAGNVVPGMASIREQGSNVGRVDALPSGYKIDRNGVITKGNTTEPSALKANGVISFGNGNYALTYEGGPSGRMYGDSTGAIKAIREDGRINTVATPPGANGFVTVSAGEPSSEKSSLGVRAQTKDSLVTLERVGTGDDYARARTDNPTQSSDEAARTVAGVNDSTVGTPMLGTRGEKQTPAAGAGPDRVPPITTSPYFREPPTTTNLRTIPLTSEGKDAISRLDPSLDSRTLTVALNGGEVSMPIDGSSSVNGILLYIPTDPDWKRTEETRGPGPTFEVLAVPKDDGGYNLLRYVAPKRPVLPSP